MRRNMLNAMLRRAVSRNPSKDALVQGARRISYSELEIQAARLAGALKDCHVGEGDTVAVWLPNGPEFVVAMFALARVRAIMLPVYPAATGEELRRLLADTPVQLLLGDGQHASLSREIAPELRVLAVQDLSLIHI